MIDHANWPFAPLEGYRAGGQFVTVSLFVELHRGTENFKPMYTIAEDDIEVDGVVYPSARRIYLASKGEHDAMRKLVGSFKQWSKLKELRWFDTEFQMWQDEWKMLQAEKARELLVKHAEGQPSAARALWDDAKKAAQGRPTKKRTKTDPTPDAADDAERVVSMIGRR